MCFMRPRAQARDGRSLPAVWGLLSNVVRRVLEVQHF
jgi:hypothetical protein